MDQILVRLARSPWVTGKTADTKIVGDASKVAVSTTQTSGSDRAD